MSGVGGFDIETAGRQGLELGGIELLTPANVQNAGNNRALPRFRMTVRLSDEFWGGTSSLRHTDPV